MKYMIDLEKDFEINKLVREHVNYQMKFYFPSITKMYFFQDSIEINSDKKLDLSEITLVLKKCMKAFLKIPTTNIKKIYDTKTKNLFFINEKRFQVFKDLAINLYGKSGR